MPLTNPNKVDWEHVWAKPPTTAVERQFSDTPEKQYHTYHTDNVCPERPPGMVRIHRSEANERRLEPCEACVSPDEDPVI